MASKDYEVINAEVEKRGISIAELGRRVGMDSELLRRSLNGMRTLKSQEFVPLCFELELNIEDFRCCLPDAS